MGGKGRGFEEEKKKKVPGFLLLSGRKEKSVGRFKGMCAVEASQKKEKEGGWRG